MTPPNMKVDIDEIVAEEEAVKRHSVDQRKGSLNPTVVNCLDSYLHSLNAEGTPVGQSLKRVPTEELDRWDWPCTQEGFETAPWQLQAGTKVFRSPLLEHIFGTIIGESPVRNMQVGSEITVNELLDSLQRRNVLPYYMGGFIRDVLQGKPANDLDLSFACTETNVHDYAQWAEGCGWKYSVKAKKQVSFQQAALGDRELGIEQAEGLQYMNFGDQDYDGWNNGVEGKVFGNKVNGRFQPGWQTPDFACNGLIYDPHLHLLIDPTGAGVDDALQMRLRIPTDKSGQWKNDHWLQNPKPFAQAARWFKFRVRGYSVADISQLEWLMSQLQAHCNERKLHVAFGNVLRKLIPAEDSDSLAKLTGEEEKQEEQEEEALEELSLSRHFKQLVREDARVCGKDDTWIQQYIDPWLDAAVDVKEEAKWRCIHCTMTNTGEQCDTCENQKPTDEELEAAASAQQNVAINVRPEEDAVWDRTLASQCIKLEGVAGENVHKYNGVYRLAKEKTNERGVWQSIEDGRLFLFYAQRNKDNDMRWHWWLSDSVPEGPGRGFMKVGSNAHTPTLVTETWECNWHSTEQAWDADPAIKISDIPEVEETEAETTWRRAEQEAKVREIDSKLQDIESKQAALIKLRERAQEADNDFQLREENLRSTRFSRSQYYCGFWADPPVVTVLTADGPRKLAGPKQRYRNRHGTGWLYTWQPNHTIGDVKETFELAMKTETENHPATNRQEVLRCHVFAFIRRITLHAPFLRNNFIAFNN
jgi:hypothetical protein